MGILAGFPYLSDPWVVVCINPDDNGTVTEGRSVIVPFKLALADVIQNT